MAPFLRRPGDRFSANKLTRPSYPLSATHVMQLLAEPRIDFSARTVLDWVQTFGPQLAQALHSHRRRLGWRWYVDEAFCFRGKQNRYLYRAIDQHGQVVDILLQDKREHTSAEALFRRALGRTGVPAHTVISDHHQPYIKALTTVIPTACHIHTGLHRARGETTKLIERSHVAMRDRLRCWRGLKPRATRQRFLESFEGLQTWRRLCQAAGAGAAVSADERLTARASPGGSKSDGNFGATVDKKFTVRSYCNKVSSALKGTLAFKPVEAQRTTLSSILGQAPDPIIMIKD